MAGQKAESVLLPSIISAARSRVEKRVLMGAPTARELTEYISWVKDVAKMPHEEVMILTIDKALGEFFRRDRGWQAKILKDANAKGLSVQSVPSAAEAVAVLLPERETAGSKAAVVTGPALPPPGGGSAVKVVNSSPLGSVG